MAHDLYLTYQEYRSYGGDLSETAFIPLEFKSRKRIDYLTDSRVQNMIAVPAAVKLCMYVLIGMESSVGRSEQAASPSVSSFNTDGYSETYSQAMDADTANAQMDALTKEYLYGEKDDNSTPLLYRGLDL